MKTFIVTIDFDDQSGHLSPQDALDNHPQVLKFFKAQKGLKLTPNCFILKTTETLETIKSSITPFLDRSENIFVLEVVINDWSAVADKKTLKALDELG